MIGWSSASSLRLSLSLSSATTYRYIAGTEGYPQRFGKASPFTGEQSSLWARGRLHMLTLGDPPPQLLSPCVRKS